MSPRAATRLTFTFLAVMTVAVTWPGLTLANRVDPRILGFPFNFAWVSGWIIASFVVLVMLDRSVTAQKKSDASTDDGGAE